MWTPIRIDFDLSSQSDTAPEDGIGHGCMLYQGADFDFAFNVTIDSEAVDFSDRQWTIKIYDKSKKNPFYVGTDIFGDSNGNINGKIAAADTRGWRLSRGMVVAGSPIAKCSYDIYSVNADGDTNLVADGVALISLNGGA